MRTLEGWASAYANAKVLPHEPPNTMPHLSTLRCSLNFSMSSTSLGVLFSIKEPCRSSAALGCDLPEPRWSKITILKNAGSKKRLERGEMPPPGPPCKKMHGTPSGLPETS